MVDTVKVEVKSRDQMYDSVLEILKQNNVVMSKEKIAEYEIQLRNDMAKKTFEWRNGCSELASKQALNTPSQLVAALIETLQLLEQMTTVLKTDKLTMFEKRLHGLSGVIDCVLPDLITNQIMSDLVNNLISKPANDKVI